MRAISVVAIALIYLSPAVAYADGVEVPTLVLNACQNREATIKKLKELAAKDDKMKEAPANAAISGKRLCAPGYEQRWRQYNATQRAALVAATQQATLAGTARRAALAKASRRAVSIDEVERTTLAHTAARSSGVTVRDLPRQYLATTTDGKDVCDDLVNLSAPGSDQELAVAQLCKPGITASFRSAGAESVAIDLVQGLGDLIEAEAKAEVTTYFLETIGKQFCGYTISTGLKTVPQIKLGEWFKTTCDAMVPASDNIVEAFTFGGLELAFKTDLKALPDKLKTVVLAWFTEQSKTTQVWMTVLGVVAEVALDAVEHKTPIEILQQLGAQADDATRDVTCDFAPDHVNAECVALLLIQIARTSADEYAGDVPPLPSKILADAFDAFCAIHGDAKATPPNNVQGACVVDPKTYLEWHARLLAFYRAAKQMIDVQSDLDRLRSQAPTDEIKARTAKEFAAALQGLVDSLGQILKEVPNTDPKIQDATTILSNTVAAYAAIIASDAPGLRKALLDILGSSLVTAEIGKSATTVRALTVVISLVTAKDRTEVKGILADVTEPVGSYKMKYGAPRNFLTVNGFVGTLGGFQFQLHHRDASGAAADRGHSDWTKFRLSAPIGLDWTVKSWTCWHLGFSGTVIDPLVLAVNTSNDQVSADWKTLVDLGVYVRLGIARSPFLLMFGGNYQPGLRDDANACNGRRCYDGAFQLGFMLSADVPILILR